MNPVAQTLLAAIQQIRGRTLHVLRQTQHEWLTWTPPGTVNHIAWHAGHALWVQDVICVQPLSGRSNLPHGWARRFGQHSQPALDTAAWPTRDELVALLTAQLSPIETALRAADPARLDPAEPRRNDIFIRDDIIHGFHDEAIHQGEMFLLLKLARGRQANPA